MQLQTVIELAAYPCQQIAVNVIKNNSQAAEANFRLWLTIVKIPYFNYVAYCGQANAMNNPFISISFW